MVKDNSEKKKDHGTFIFMPEEAIKSLRSELSNLLGEKLGSGVLFRFGYRCGEALMERTQSNNFKGKDMDKVLPRIWEQTGLGKIVSVEEISEEEVEIVQKESAEAKALGKTEKPSCDLTRGYLAGIASMLSNKKFYCLETDCISEGKDTCKFQLLMFPHKVYVPKKGS
ncbi:MAG: XylR N-terminal domain-containing protein [Thermoplasmata archaeon]|nr:MAG: XylR N-terminal domain-containing protein [Thermoplasmata archaeon]